MVLSAVLVVWKHPANRNATVWRKFYSSIAEEDSLWLGHGVVHKHDLAHSLGGTVLERGA